MITNKYLKKEKDNPWNKYIRNKFVLISNVNTLVEDDNTHCPPQNFDDKQRFLRNKFLINNLFQKICKVWVEASLCPF